MKKAIITLSIDDGAKNLLPVIENKLLPLKIPATLNVVPGFIDGSREREFESLTKEELIDIYKTGLFEIANHSYSHTNEYADILEGKNKLIEWLKLDKNAVLGFASPGSGINIKRALEEREELEKLGVAYVRTRDYGDKEKFESLKQKYLETNDSRYYIQKESHAFYNKGDFAISSLVVYKGLNDLEEMKLLTDYAVKEGKRLTLMFHNFATENEKLYSHAWAYDTNKFYQFIDYVDRLRNQDKLDIITSIEGLK